MLTAVRMDVEQGASLSEAMAKYPKAFNDLYIAMVKSGETGGVLDDVLLRLADEIEKEVQLRQKIKSAMTYPIAVVVLVFLIMSAMLLFVVPQFEGIYKELGGTLPLPTRVLLAMSKIFKQYWWICGLLAIGVHAVPQALQEDRARPGADRRVQAARAGLRERCSTRPRCPGSPAPSAC